MNKMKLVLITITLLSAAALLAACGSSTTDGGAAKSFASGPAGNNLTATLASADGSLRKGKQAERGVQGETEAPRRDFAPKPKAKPATKPKSGKADAPRPKQDQLNRALRKRGGSDQGE